LLLGNLTAGFLGSCFFFLLFKATIPKADAPNGMKRSRSSQLKKPKFVDPESAVLVDVDVDVGVGVDVEGTIEIAVGVGLFVNGLGLTVEVCRVVEADVGAGVRVSVGVGVGVSVGVEVGVSVGVGVGVDVGVEVSANVAEIV
jgi:hypothetical protein